MLILICYERKYCLDKSSAETSIGNSKATSGRKRGVEKASRLGPCLVEEVKSF